MKSLTSMPTFAALLISATLVGACNRGPDPKDRVSRELKSADIQNLNVDYDSKDKVVHLKGAVDNQSDKNRAEEIAHRAIGTTGSVANELTIKGVNDRTADDMDNAIRRELNAKVNNDRTLEDRDINFDVNNGVVTIKGEVRSEAEKDTVNTMARSTQNVKDVVNALEVNPRVGQHKTGRTQETASPDRERRPDSKTAPAPR